MIDTNNNDALRAEAERRSVLRANGIRHFDLPPIAIPPADSRALEKQIERADGMNKTERRRSVELEALKRTGQIRSWEFEGVTLRLAHRCRLTPDFFIEHNDHSIEFEEIKGGFIREDSWVKLKVAAREYPMFRWTLRQWKGGRWHVSEVPAVRPTAPLTVRNGASLTLDKVAVHAPN